ncbi:metallophosphoesterase [Candidatus Woesearchaeota archaeon]|nr:metallophosphoesterase [Candidatus Woesearchaeota archaeon]
MTLKILAFGDLHGDTSLAEKLAKQADDQKVDLVVLCGDITHFENSTDGLIGPFVQRNKKVILVPGNHESLATADFLATLYNVKNIHGYSVRYENVGFFGCGGANIGIAQIDEDEIHSILTQGFEKIKYLDKKVMVTHVHPEGSLMEKFTDIFPGSTGVRRAIDALQPDFLLCSHVHEAEGIEEMIGHTKVINVGKKGKIIDL